jgi:YVTN family beta-propeller protein
MKKRILPIGLLVLAIGLSACNSEEGKAIAEPEKQYIYVPNAADGTISVIDPTEDKTIDTITLGTEQASHGIALSLDGKKLYTGTGFSGKSVVVIDTNTKEKIKEIPLNEGVHGIDLSPNGKYLYVSLNPGLGKNGGSLAIFETETMEKVAVVQTDNGPAHVAVTPSGSQVWVANVNANTVSVIDTQTNQLLKSIEVGEVPNEVTITPDGKWAYAANVKSDFVSVINAETLEVIKAVKAGDGPHGVTVSPNGKELWVSNNNSNDITVINTKTLTTKLTIPTGSYANHVGFSKDGKWAYVSNRQSNDVVKIDAEKKEVAARIQVGNEPHEISLEDNVSTIAEPIEYTFDNASSNKVISKEVEFEDSIKTANADNVIVQALKLLPSDDTNGMNIDFEKNIAFQISLTTHSGDLSSLELDKNTFLVDTNGTKIKPAEWTILSNDAHHPLYLVTFPKNKSMDITLEIGKLDESPVQLTWSN